jgi:hypothetical protein
MGVLSLLLIAALALPLVSAFWDAVVSVDTGTFDKVVTPESTTIVKIDIKNPHGDEMMAWRKFAEKIGGMGSAKVDVLPVEVNCHHELWWDDESFFNMDLAERFNVDLNVARPEDFRPRILLFRKGKQLFSKPVRYMEPTITSENLMRFLQKHSADSWFGLPGTFLSLDAYARVFLKAGGGGESKEAVQARDALLEEARLEVEALRAGRRRTVTKAMRKLGLGGALAADLNEEETEEIFDKESQSIRDRDEAREDLEYYLTVMALIQERGVNAALDEKHALTEEIQAFAEAGENGNDANSVEAIRLQQQQRRSKNKGQRDVVGSDKPETAAQRKARKLRLKSFVSGKRNHVERLEHQLNILSVFRSAGAVNVTNPDEVARIKAERLAKFAARRKALTGRSTLSASQLRKLATDASSENNDIDGDAPADVAAPEAAGDGDVADQAATRVKDALERTRVHMNEVLARVDPHDDEL